MAWRRTSEQTHHAPVVAVAPPRQAPTRLRVAGLDGQRLVDRRVDATVRRRDRHDRCSSDAAVGISWNPVSTGSSFRGKAGPPTTRPRVGVVDDAAGCEIGDEQVRADFAQRASRGLKAGRRTGPRRRVYVPAPEEKQGQRAKRDDSVHAAGVIRLAGGDEQGVRASGARAPHSCSRGCARRGLWPAPVSVMRVLVPRREHGWCVWVGVGEG